MAKLLRVYIVFTALFAFCGCQSGELHFNIRFDEIRGLKFGDKIFFEGNTVGDVGNIVYTQEGDYMVEAGIQPNFVNAATHDSKFYIADDPKTDGKKAIEIIQEKAGGKVLRDGETIKGSIKPTIFKEIFGHLHKKAIHYQDQLDDDVEALKESLRRNSQELEKGLEDTLDELVRQFSSLSEKAQQVPDSQILKQLEETLNELAGEMKHAQEAIREKIKEQLIPEIQRRLNMLGDSLERYNRRDEIDPLDRQLENIRET